MSTAVEAPPARSKGDLGMRLPSWALSTLVAMGVVVLWELAARTVYADSYRLSPPSAVVMRLAEDRSLYGRNLWHTSWNAAWGFLWGNLAAIALAGLASLVPLLRRSIGAASLITFCVPVVALAPILRVITGPGNGTPIALSAVAVFFTTYVAALLGFDSAPGQRPGCGPLPGAGPIRGVSRRAHPSLGAGHVRRPADRRAGRLPRRPGR